MTLTKAEVISEIDAIFEALGASTSLLPPAITEGKMYEAWVLASVLENLNAREGFRFSLVGGPKLVLKGSHGPINRSYPHFVGRSQDRAIEVWTDVEFATLGHSMRHPGSKPGVGDKHELDIVVVPLGTDGYPRHFDILWGIECKHTSFQKAMARAMFGVRRELSFLRDDQPTYFANWPKSRVPAVPASVLTAYSTDRKIERYREAGRSFGIGFRHLPLPR